MEIKSLPIQLTLCTHPMGHATKQPACQFPIKSTKQAKNNIPIIFFYFFFAPPIGKAAQPSFQLAMHTRKRLDTYNSISVSFNFRYKVWGGF